MPQPTLEQLFRVKGHQGNIQEEKRSEKRDFTKAGTPEAFVPPPSSSVEAAAAAAHQRKENQPPAHAAACGGDTSTGSQPRSLPTQERGAAQNSRTRPLASKSTQLFLDLGQRDFGASRCSVCGMVYTKGLEEDEKLHKAFHQGASQGFKFQGWPQERVVLSELAQGRLLLVLQTDPAAHVKKVRELCLYVEKAHGMSPGWLLSAPQARVFLYVSLQRRIVGLAVVEPLKQAYRVVAPQGSQEQEVDSAAQAGQQQQQQQQRRQQQGPSGPSKAAACQQLPQKRPQQQQQQLLWPGLRKRGRLAALGRTAASGNVLLSDPSQHSASQGPSSCLEADSCPTSLLAAAGRLDVQAESLGGSMVDPDATATAAAAVPAASGGMAAGKELNSQEGPLLMLSPANDSRQVQVSSQVQQEMVGHAKQQAAQATMQQPALAAPMVASTSAVQQADKQELQPRLQAAAPQEQVSAAQSRQVTLPWQQGVAASIPHGSGSSQPAGSAAAASGGRASGGGSTGLQRSSRSNAAAAVLAAGGSRSLLVDRRRPVRARLGVRMVWVLQEQRRQGVATRLLDAARCNMIPGYVVPCSEVAFSQPTGDGAVLAAAFTGTQQFMVYA